MSDRSLPAAPARDLALQLTFEFPRTQDLIRTGPGNTSQILDVLEEEYLARHKNAPRFDVLRMRNAVRQALES